MDAVTKTKALNLKDLLFKLNSQNKGRAVTTLPKEVQLLHDTPFVCITFFGLRRLTEERREEREEKRRGKVGEEASVVFIRSSFTSSLLLAFRSLCSAAVVGTH